MGRHRRSAAGRATTDHAAEVTHPHLSGTASGPRPRTDDRAPMGIAPYLNPEAYAETNARSTAYLFATDDERGPADDAGAGPGTGGMPTAEATNGGPAPAGGAGGEFATAGGAGGEFAMAGAPRRGSATAGGTGRDFTAPDSTRGGFSTTDGTRGGFTAPGAIRGGFNAPDGIPGDFATADGMSGGFTPGGGGPRGHRRRKKAVQPVRTGLLGVSAAVALGTAAVAAGVVPGLQNYQLGGGPGAGGGRVQAADSPGNSAAEQGGTSGSAEPQAGGAPSAGTGARQPSAPAPSAPSSKPPAESASPSPAPGRTADGDPAAKPTPAETEAPPAHSAPKSPQPPQASSAPVTVSVEAVAAAEVLKLVNEERAKVGCSALSANSSLTTLAGAFSDDMAARGFFDHTDPDGATPWDRAAKAGITDLGGENIARGQTDAAAVMDAWMNSPGHRANILNCDYTTLGVGVHFGTGGPWWTQDFGY
ncbi:CAP domain-containing protein [Streptomyces sp. NBC_00820]|uniref:CAP domain-containing protein n=1 Tax=Streptomyces sp. NBC_00820 TaxID=2975842 RepID=UPI002ED071B1|nr:CAP domain-containing protein [Streptomyces sp. NBC_00820]